MPGRRHDLDDVAVPEPRAKRHHLAVHACPDALVADVGVDRIGKIDGRGIAGERLDLPFRREDVDLVGIQLDLQVLQEFLRVADFLLPLEELTEPDEILLVAVGADSAFLVLPVRRDPFFGDAVHLGAPDLHLEGKAMVADDRRVQRLVAVRPRHRDEVLDAAGHGGPRLVNDPERRVAVLDRLRDDAQRVRCAAASASDGC